MAASPESWERKEGKRLQNTALPIPFFKTPRGLEPLDVGNDNFWVGMEVSHRVPAKAGKSKTSSSAPLDSRFLSLPPSPQEPGAQMISTYAAMHMLQSLGLMLLGTPTPEFPLA